MSSPVFIHPVAQGVQANDILVLDGPEGHHAAQVQRLRVGQAIDLVDGWGLRASGLVVGVSTGRVEVRVETVSRDIDRPLVLVQALTKGNRDESAIEAATELGVTRVVPWQASRSVVRWEGKKAETGRERWGAIVSAAAKVARRALIPEVLGMVTTPGLVALISEATSAGALVLLLHEGAGEGISGRVLTPEAVGETWLLIGPEGGIDDEEVSALVDAGALPTRLGPYILRSGTAGPAAIAAFSALGGRWDPPTREVRALG